MTIHITNPEVIAQLEELAAARGLHLDDALRLAVSDAIERERGSGVQERLRRMREVAHRVASLPDMGEKADKASFDELSGDTDWTPEEKLRRMREISARVAALPRTGLKAEGLLRRAFRRLMAVFLDASVVVAIILREEDWATLDVRLSDCKDVIISP